MLDNYDDLLNSIGSSLGSPTEVKTVEKSPQMWRTRIREFYGNEIRSDYGPWHPSKETAETAAERLRSWGYDCQVQSS